jgi:GTP cyclohydrolase I
MRGIRTPHRMISSALSGAFHKSEQRMEFLRLID